MTVKGFYYWHNNYSRWIDREIKTFWQLIVHKFHLYLTLSFYTILKTFLCIWNETHNTFKLLKATCQKCFLIDNDLNSVQYCSSMIFTRMSSTVLLMLQTPPPLNFQSNALRTSTSDKNFCLFFWQARSTFLFFQPFKFNVVFAVMTFMMIDRKE